MSIKVMFHSVLLDSDIAFSTTSNGSDMASFCVRHGNEKYKMLLFADANENNCFTRMRTCVEKGFLKKGKPLWIEAEMTYYEKVIIPDSAWKGLLKQIPEQDIKRIFGSTKNPSKGKFPRFKVTGWDFAIPKEYHEKNPTVNPEQTVMPVEKYKTPFCDQSRLSGGDAL